MNNRGQTLILFVLLLPVIVGFLAFFVDLSMVNYEKNKLDGIILSNLQIIVDNEIKDVSKITNIYAENGIKSDEILVEEDEIVIMVNNKISSVFGKILDFDFYKLVCTYKGNYINKEVLGYEEN